MRSPARMDQPPSRSAKTQQSQEYEWRDHRHGSLSFSKRNQADRWSGAILGDYTEDDKTIQCDIFAQNTMPTDSFLSDHNENYEGEDVNNNNLKKHHALSNGITKNFSPSSGRHTQQSTSSGDSYLFGLRNENLLVLGITMLQEGSRGIQVSSLFRYLEFMGMPRSSMGVCVSLYSLGRMLAGVPFAYWSEASGASRDTFVTGGILAIIASVIYFTSWALVSVTTAPVYVARFLLGACSGPISVTRSYLINHSKKNDKTRLVTFCGLAQYIGFTISPMIVVVVNKFLTILQNAHIVNDSGTEWIKGDRNLLDSLRERTILESILSMLTLLLLNVYLLIKIFQILPKYDLSTLPGGLEDISISSFNDSKNDGTSYVPVPSDSGSRVSPLCDIDPSRKPRLAFIIYFFVNLVIRGSIGIAETLTPQTFENFTSYKPIFLSTTSSYFLILGLIGLPVYLLIDYFQRNVISGPKLLSIGITCVAIGLYLTADPLPVYTSSSWPKFLVGTGLIWSVGSPMCQTLSTSLFSDYLQKRKQTAYIGWITAAGSVGRIVFPAVVGIDKLTAYFFSMASVFLCLFCMFGMCYLYGLNLKELN